MAQELMLNCYKRLNDLRLTEQEREIPVIITLNDWAGRVELEEKGLRGRACFREHICGIGHAYTSEVKDVAQLEQVESIEFDGERAISSNA